MASYREGNGVLFRCATGIIMSEHESAFSSRLLLTFPAIFPGSILSRPFFLCAKKSWERKGGSLKVVKAIWHISRRKIKIARRPVNSPSIRLANSAEKKALKIQKDQDFFVCGKCAKTRHSSFRLFLRSWLIWHCSASRESPESPNYVLRPFSKNLKVLNLANLCA